MAEASNGAENRGVGAAAAAGAESVAETTTVRTSADTLRLVPVCGRLARCEYDTGATV